LAQFTVAAGKCVVYDGRNLYHRTDAYSVEDTLYNYQKSVKDVADGLIVITEAFTNVVNMEEQYLCVIADMTSATWNTVATHTLFGTTGGVQMKIIPECTGSLTAGAGATIGLGVEGATGAFVADTDFALIDVGEVWDTAIDGTITSYGDSTALGLDKKVFGGLSVGYEVKTNALTGGSIAFHCYWTPLNATGSVVAGDGSALPV
jgi:hypothetical protein